MNKSDSNPFPPPAVIEHRIVALVVALAQPPIISDNVENDADWATIGTKENASKCGCIPTDRNKGGENDQTNRAIMEIGNMIQKGGNEWETPWR